MSTGNEPDPRQAFANEDVPNISPQSDEQPEQPEPRHAGTSLKERMLRRRDELAQRRTVIIPVPRYEAFVAVELKAIPWEKTEAILTKNQRQPTRVMYNAAAEETVTATVAFHEIKEDGTTELIEDARHWTDVAVAFLNHDPPDAPFMTRERIALVALTGDQGVMALNGRYRQWLGGANVGLEEELKQDFS